MESQVVVDIAGSTETPAVSKNISVSDLANRRIGQLADQGVVDEDQDSGEETLESESLDPEGDQNQEEVLSQLNLEDMSEEELNELAQKLGSRAVARFGKLTARAKAAEERLRELESKLSQDPGQVLGGNKEIKDNPLDNITTVEELSSKSDEANNVIEWAENLLFESDGYSADDVVTEVEGQELTKNDVRKYLLNARKIRDKFIPDRLRKIQEVEKGKELKEGFGQLALKELPWLASEEHALKKQYDLIINDPRIAQLDKALPPDISAQLPYLLAHAANSIYGSSKPKGSIPSMKPPSNAVTSAGSPGKSASGSSKRLSDVSKRFLQSGSKDDYITLRTLQLQQT
jgi:hypothetical protein